MSTRLMIGLIGLMAILGAAYKEDLAATYVAAGVTAIIYLLHTIEFKLNRLLDPYNIRVMDSDIRRD